MFAFTHPAVVREDLKVYNGRNEPFRICGLYKPEQPGLFRRMPQEVAEKTGKRINLLHTNTAGARLRFATDSSYIAVGAVFPPMEFPSARTAAFAGANGFSFDLFADGHHQRVLWPETLVQQGSVMSFDVPDGTYQAILDFGSRKTRQITLCFPSFVNVEDIYIGLQNDAVVEPAAPYCNENPVVFYGSSITQGACASRSGNSYENVLSRKLNFDYVNLGFASGCRAQEPVIDYLCTLKTPLLVFDYDHNAPTLEFLEQTHLPALRKLRAAHPHIPFIVLSKPDRDTGLADCTARAKLIEENCRILAAESAAPVHFINGQDIFTSHDMDMMTVDGTHPTDLGMHCIAQALYEVMKLYF